MADRRFYFFWIFFFLAVSLCLSEKAIAGDKDRYFELGIGGGTNLFQSLNTEQAIITPAVNWKIKDVKSLWFRLEGDIELINDDRRTTLVFGAAPMLRLFLKEMGNNKPFIEAGAGANFISRNRIEDRHLGGSFVFSFMGGVGYEFKTGGRPVGISYRYRHISNAGLYAPNEGIDSQYLILSIGF